MRPRALYAHDGNPIIALMAEEGIAALARALPALHADARDLEARATTRCTARGCAAPCSATSAMALHHKLCHTLGGSFNLPHAETHTVVLPHALAYNAAAAPQAMARIARAMALVTPPIRCRARAVYDLATRPRRADRAARHRHAGRRPRPRRRPRGANTYPNPRPLDRAALRALLQRAYDGARTD